MGVPTKAKIVETRGPQRFVSPKLEPHPHTHITPRIGAIVNGMYNITDLSLTGFKIIAIDINNQSHNNITMVTTTCLALCRPKYPRILIPHRLSTADTL
jgi:hypothetical protein